LEASTKETEGNKRVFGLQSLISSYLARKPDLPLKLFIHFITMSHTSVLIPYELYIMNHSAFCNLHGKRCLSVLHILRSYYFNEFSHI